MPADPRPCEHKEFTAHVDVTRIADSSTWYADLRVSCADCGQAMRFVGFPAGMSPAEPMVSVDGTEARLPFRPYTGGVAAGLTYLIEKQADA